MRCGRTRGAPARARRSSTSIRRDVVHRQACVTEPHAVHLQGQLNGSKEEFMKRKVPTDQELTTTRAKALRSGGYQELLKLAERQNQEFRADLESRHPTPNDEGYRLLRNVFFGSGPLPMAPD